MGNSNTIITPAEIKKKAAQIWDSGKFLSAWCKCDNIFPLDITFGKVAGSSISDNFAKIRDGIWHLADSSKEKIGYGYSIEYKTVSHRQLGTQNIPNRIFIETEDDFLKLCGKKKQFDIFKEAYSLTKKELPEACEFIHEKPLLVIKHLSIWNKLIRICTYFKNNPNSNIYIRQIVIPGIDTKFIEANKKIISALLIYLNTGKPETEALSLSQHGFEKHLGLKYDEPLIRFRILDKDIFIKGLSDITLPLSQFSSLKINAEKIFITENKTNGLAFPMVKNSIVIFGLGYGIQSLKEVSWIKNCKVFYWGDIDTHGFSILSLTRNIISSCTSMLMDEETLHAHIESSVKEPLSKRFTGELSCLTNKEKALFDNLKNNSFGENLRIEQEFIRFDYLLEWLNKNNIYTQSPLVNK